MAKKRVTSQERPKTKATKKTQASGRNLAKYWLVQSAVNGGTIGKFESSEEAVAKAKECAGDRGERFIVLEAVAAFEKKVVPPPIQEVRFE